jgi:hypothetical protein
MKTEPIPEKFEKVLAALAPDRRAQVEQLAAQLSRNKDIVQAAEILEKSKSLEVSHFMGGLGWAMALASIIAIVANEV